MKVAFLILGLPLVMTFDLVLFVLGTAALLIGLIMLIDDTEFPFTQGYLWLLREAVASESGRRRDERRLALRRAELELRERENALLDRQLGRG